MSARWLLLVGLAGLLGSFLYSHGVPGWLVYVARHVVYQAGR